MARTGRGGASGDGSRAARNDQAPTTSSREARGVADEVGLGEDTRGAIRGTEQKGPRTPTKADEGREGVNAAAAADFAQSLAEMAVADPVDPQTDRATDRDEDFDGELELSIEGDDVGVAHPARAATVEPGGEDDPDDAPAAPLTPEEAPAAAPVGSPVPRIRPRARSVWLGVDDALEAGSEAAILFGYQGRTAVGRIEELDTGEWLALVRAMREAVTEIGRAFVLKALGANRDPRILPEFARRVCAIGEDDAVRLQHARGPIPGPDAESRDLRRHYDPIEALDPKPDVHQAAPSDPWRVPAWLRGIPRAALDLCVVAVDQALTNDLRRETVTDEGATDALTAALAPHGKAHPSLQRWSLNLAARAESHGGLVRMRDVMMSARAGSTR